MNDLDQAIETITEGGQALGVGCEDVYNAMLDDKWFGRSMLRGIHEDNPKHKLFYERFDECARNLLEEARRANLELEAGL